jgi:acyl-CoA reductase-like NAD-dependent aldehyde dehydrogenase
MAPSAIDPATTKPVQKLDFQGGFVQIINGKSAPTAESRHGVNPATLKAKPDVPVATQGDLDRAVDAAKEAFKKWSKVPYEERKAAVLAWADAMESMRTEFRDLLIAEQGKPVRNFLHIFVDL